MHRLIILLCIFFIQCTPPKPEQKTHQKDTSKSEYLVIKESLIPGAGKGLFAIKEIPANLYLGDYTGEQIDKNTYQMLKNYNASQYLFSIPECANQKDFPYINGDPNHYFSKMNYAPEFIAKKPTNLQNVEFKAFCEKPYIRVFTTRVIKQGEELYVSYGKNYNYSFMKNKQVQDFFLKVANIKLNKDEEFHFSE